MSLASKYLKLVQVGYETYTGPIGQYEFENGVSTVMIPRVDRDRLAAAFQFVEFVEEGVDEIPAGVAERLVANAHVRSDDAGPSERMTDEEKAIEDAMVKITREDDKVVYSREDLAKIADKKGINGLREIAAPWGVKHRAVSDLIALIIQAQENWLAARQAEFERRGIVREEFAQSLVPKPAEVEKTAEAPAEDTPAEKPAEDATTDAPAVVVPPPAEESEDDEIEDDPVETPSPEEAAETGDLAAALNQE